LIKIINQFDYLFQIHDSITDLFESKRVMKEQFIELKSDLLLVTRALSMQTLEYFNEIALAMHNNNNKTINSQAKELQQEIDSANRALLLLMIDPKRTDAGALTNFVTYSQRLKDKLTNLSHLHIKIEDIEEVSNTLQTD
jgi:phosphate:Na+ symporter